MTQFGQPALPPPDDAGASAALAELGATSDAAVGAATEAVSGMTPEQEAGARRGHRVQEDKAWADMRVVCIKALPFIIIPASVLAIGTVLVVTGIWLHEQVTDTAKLESLVSTVIAGLGGSALTFLGQHVFRGKQDGS